MKKKYEINQAIIDKQNIYKKIASKLYQMYIMAWTITMNLFFFVFFHNKYDLAPNIALFVTSLPIIIIQIMKLSKR